MRLPLWGAAWIAGLSALPAGATAMTPLDTLTCRAFAAEVAAFDVAHAGTPHADMPRYLEIAAHMRTRTPEAGAREVAAALDDTLVDCAADPDARLLDILARHRIAGDRWRD